MSCFSSVTTANVAAPDPTKHVNYNLGMVLGVEDFTQDFAYVMGRHRWGLHDLGGYGTVRGLRVAVDVDAERGPRAVVESGAAVSPSGQLICVPHAQCAYLRDALAAKADDIDFPIDSPLTSEVRLYVVLCYRDCPTDNVPIAGEPCRSEDELTAPSRLTDDFMLELRLTPPVQREEDAVRDFVAWLKQVEITDSVVSSTALDEFLDAIRAAAQLWLSSPLSSPPNDFMVGSPPASVQIRPEDACEYMRAAFRIWVTELRPKWIARWHGCAATNFPSDNEAEGDCVLLAELIVPVVPISPGNWTVADSPAVEINEDRRPFMVHLRMLQEWMTCACQCSAVAAAVGPGEIPEPPSEGESELINVDETMTLSSESDFVIVDTTDGNIDLTLPPTSGNDGHLFMIKHAAGGNRLRVLRAGRDVVDGERGVDLNEINQFVQLVANENLGAWHIVGSNLR